MKRYAVSIPFRYWESVVVKAESKEEAIEKVINHSSVNELVKRAHISCDELDWDYNWLDTCIDRTDDVVEEVEE